MNQQATKSEDLVHVPMWAKIIFAIFATPVWIAAFLLTALVMGAVMGTGAAMSVAKEARQ